MMCEAFSGPNKKQKQLSSLWLAVLLSTVACALWSNAHAERVTKAGVLQEVVVLCVKFADTTTTTYQSCQDIVDIFNAEVGPWYGTVSDGETDFLFILPTYHAGVTPSADHWLRLTRMTPPPFFGINTLQEEVFDVVDSLIDFSNVNRVVVVSPGPASFGQAAGCSDPLEDPYLCSRAIRVDEADEEQWQEPGGGFHYRQRMALVAVSEWDAGVGNGIQGISAILQHEIGHLLGLPDRYAKLIVGSTSRDYATGYDPMGLTWDLFFNVHFLAHPQARLQFMNDAASPITVPKTTTMDVDIVPPAYSTSNGALRSVIRLPMETPFSLQTFRGYTVEARDRSVANDGVLQNGVIVTWVDPFVGDGRDLLVVDDPDHPVSLWEAAFEVGDVFEDLARGVRIEVLSTIPWPGGYTIRVANTQPSDMKPDPRITPWNNRWESVDIWIDSPTNGFDTYAYTEGNRDRPAVRSQASNPEIVNRFYFRIHNDGFTDAKNVQVKGYYTLPGMGQSTWTLVGQTTLGSIAPGGDVTSYFNWVVPDGIVDAHACLKVEIQDDASDLSLENNFAQENVFEFETVQNSPWHARSQQLLVENPDDKRSAYVRMDVENLPAQWAVQISPEYFVLAPGDSQMVDFTIYPGGPPTKPSDGYEAGYLAQTPVVAYATYEDMESVTIGGVTAWTRLTLPTKLTLGVIDAMTGGAVLGGCLTENGLPMPNRPIGVQIASGKKADFLHTNTDQRGCYQVTLSRLGPGVWEAEAFYEGVGAYGSSRSRALRYTIK